MIILGLAGLARSGKNTIADYLVKHYGFVKFAFSDALYDEVQQAYGLENQDLLRDVATKDARSAALCYRRCNNAEFRSVMWAQYPTADENAGHTPRQVLQWWGTEYRRVQDPDYWIKIVEQFIIATQEDRYPEHRQQYFVETGTRFENERAWIKHNCFGDHRGDFQWDGNIWHIHRGGVIAPGADHSSAAPLPVLEGERELWNNDTIARLHQGVDLLMRTSARFVRVEPLLPMLPDTKSLVGQGAYPIQLESTE